MLPSRMVGSREVAKAFGVHARTIANWSRRGIIPGYRLSPRVVRFDMEEVREAIKRHQEGAGG